MSFGIEFDIDDYDPTGEKDAAAAPATVDAPPGGVPMQGGSLPEARQGTQADDGAGDNPTSHPAPAPATASVPSEAPATETKDEHQFDGLLALAESLRRREREKWIIRYARLNVRDVPPGDKRHRQDGSAGSFEKPAGAEDARNGVVDNARDDASDDWSGKAGGHPSDDVAAPTDHRQTVAAARGAQKTPVVPADGDGVAPERNGKRPVRPSRPLPEEAREDAMRTESPHPEEEISGTRLARALKAYRDNSPRIMCASSLAMAVLAVVCALVPVVGVLMWAIPAALSVGLATWALLSGRCQGRMTRLLVIAMLVAVSAAGVALVASTAYIHAGVVSVRRGATGTTVTVG